MSDIKPWKTLQSDIVYENDRWKIRKDICQLPEGPILQNYFVREEADIAVVFCVTKNHEIVLVRQYRQAAGLVTWELPGGLRERHDINIAEAARRELLEETGYSSDELREIASWHSSPATSTAKVYLFFSPAAERIAAPKYIVGETTEVATKSADDVMTMLSRGEIVSVLHTAALYRGVEELKKVS